MFHNSLADWLLDPTAKDQCFFAQNLGNTIHIHTMITLVSSTSTIWYLMTLKINHMAAGRKLWQPSEHPPNDQSTAV